MEEVPGTLFNPLNLSGRKILVTGASSGIGRAAAVYLSRLGASVVVTGRNQERLNATMAMLYGDRHYAEPCDLTENAELDEFFQHIVQDGIKLNGLVHCAGIPWVRPLKVLDRRQISRIMENNFYPFVELVRQYSKNKYSCGGSIVALSSILAVSPRGYEAGYIASKAAIDAVIGSFAFELAPRKIRINGIYCGNIMTEMVQRTIDELHNEDKVQKIADQGLFGMGHPDDIASVIAFLISDMAGFITGRIIYADGGML